MPELVKLLDGPAISYGKGAIVGIAGEMEHGGDRIECEGSGCGVLCSTYRSGTRTIPGHFRISIPSPSRWPMHRDQTRSWS